MTKQDLLEETLNIDESHLNDEFVRISAQLASAAKRQADASYEWQMAKVERDRTKARLFTKYFAKLLDEKEKPTEARVNALVESDDELYAARVRELTLERAKGEAAALAEGLRSKKDMLVSLGANYRAEMQGDPSLRSLAHSQRLDRENR